MIETVVYKLKCNACGHQQVRTPHFLMVFGRPLSCTDCGAVELDVVTS